MATRWFNKTLANKLQTLPVSQNNSARGILASGWTGNSTETSFWQLFYSWVLLIKGSSFSYCFLSFQTFSFTYTWIFAHKWKAKDFKINKNENVESYVSTGCELEFYNFFFFYTLAAVSPLWLAQVQLAPQEFLNICLLSMSTSFRRSVYDQKS